MHIKIMPFGLVCQNLRLSIVFDMCVSSFLQVLLPTNCLRAFDHFVGLALEGLSINM